MFGDPNFDRKIFNDKAPFWINAYVNKQNSQCQTKLCLPGSNASTKSYCLLRIFEETRNNSHVLCFFENGVGGSFTLTGRRSMITIFLAQIEQYVHG